MTGRQAITHKKMTTTQKSVFYSFLVTVAVVVIAFLIIHPHTTVIEKVPTDNPVGLTQSNPGEFPEGIKNGDLAERFFSRTLPAQQNSVVLFKNTSGRDISVNWGSVDVLTGQTASTTYDVYIFATTSTSISTVNDFLTAQTGTPAKQQLIRGVTIATSSTATTTSSTYAAAVSKGNGSILVPDGSTLFGYMVQTYPLGAGGACNGVTCEPATSTNRGFNPVFNVRVSYRP